MTFESSLKAEVAKKLFSGNPVHNIVEYYKVFVQFPFTTSKTELDI